MNLCDAGVVQSAEDLRLAGEALEQGRAGESGAEELEGDGATRVVLLRLVDRAHAAFAQHSHHAVAGDGRKRGGRRREQGRARLGQGAAQERLGSLGPAVELQKLLHGRAQDSVPSALLVQERCSPRRLQVDRLVEQLFDAPGQGLVHREFSFGEAGVIRAASVAKPGCIATAGPASAPPGRGLPPSRPSSAR